MPDKRNNDLLNIIKMIFNKKCCSLDTKKNIVIIGEGKYANKCSFLETDKEYYLNLIKYTFKVDGIEFVYKNNSKGTKFNRFTAINNAIKYLNEKHSIIINCNLYCESEQKLLGRYISQILEEILCIMFLFGKNYNEYKYNQSLKNIVSRYQKEITTIDIVQLIYTTANWSDVESFRSSKICNDCILVDNGTDWRNYYGICHVNTGLKLQIKYDEDPYFHSGIAHQCDKTYNLQNKPVALRCDTFCYLDFFHLDYDYYIPNKFCYYTNIESKIIKEKLESEGSMVRNLPCSFANEYVTNELELGSVEFEQAIRYIQQTYCSDRKPQYMNTFSIITEIMSILLRTNYRDFYSDKFNISKTAFNVGLNQLKYFFEDNKIQYSITDINTIYKYLITVWLDRYRYYLEIYNFEEMFNLYSDKIENKKYKECIDANRKKINQYKELNVLVNAHDSYKEFYKRNIELINDFESIVSIEKNESIEQIAALKFKREYNPFMMLKESIKTFQQKTSWKVPYYVRKTIIEGEEKHEYADTLQGYGHVGCKMHIEIPQDEKFTIDGPDYITLGFNDNVAEITYKLKSEYISENPDKTLHHNTVKNTNTSVILKNNHKYHIEFEACGTNKAPFSFIIIKRNTNKSFDVVFENNDMVLNSTFSKFSFEFTYNGENEDLCYPVFGYGNMIDGYKIQNIKLSEIE